MRKSYLLFTMLVLGLSAHAAGDSLDRALSLLQASRFKEAHELLLPLHHRGSTEASRILGCMYLNGDGVDPNIARGRELLLHASTNRNAEATFQLANTYRSEDDAMYARYQEAAAQQGHLIAAQEIGRAYYSAQGVSRNDTLAYRWLFSIQIRTPVAVATWTEPLAELEARMSEDEKEDGRIMAWNHVYRELKTGWYQEEFDKDNASAEGPIRKGEYDIVDGRIIMTGGTQNQASQAASKRADPER